MMRAADLVDTRQALQERFERRLAARILDAGLLHRARVQAAIEHQMVLGGHLATALYELALLDAMTLTRLSVETLGIRAADVRKVAAAPPDVRAMVPRALVERARLVPFHTEGHTLHVATAEPWDVHSLEAASHASGRRVEPYFLAEVPLVRLLASLYGVPMQARFEMLPQLRRTYLLQAEQRRSAPEGGPLVVGELISEESFASLYAQREPAPLDAPQPAAPSEPPAAEPTEPAASEELFDLVVEEAVGPLEPITVLAEAMAALDAAGDRAAVGDVLARFALSKGRRVALLVHHGGGWTGWAGAGEGVQPERVRALALPAAPGSILGLVSKTGSPAIGPLAPHAVHDRLLAALAAPGARGRPRTVGLFPVHFRGRVVFGVYLDGGPKADVATDVAEILVLAQRVAATLARLVERRLAR